MYWLKSSSKDLISPVKLWPAGSMGFPGRTERAVGIDTEVEALASSKLSVTKRMRLVAVARSSLGKMACAIFS